MMFFEIRHLLIHRAGLMDQAFVDQYGEELGPHSKADGRLPLTVGFALKGVRAVNSLIEEVDQRLISAALLTRA